MKSQITTPMPKPVPDPKPGELWQMDGESGVVVFAIIDGRHLTVTFQHDVCGAVVLHSNSNSLSVGEVVPELSVRHIKPFTGTLKLWNEDRSLF